LRDDDIGVEFKRWHNKAKQLASYIGTEDELPRVPRVQVLLNNSGKCPIQKSIYYIINQCNRSNVPADTPILNYKRSISIPFIDILMQQLYYSNRQLLASECFAESNTIFNCQTRDASPREI